MTSEMVATVDDALGFPEHTEGTASYPYVPAVAGQRADGPSPASPTGTRVALVHLGNTGGLGTTRRVDIWNELLAAAGVDVVEVNLLRQHRRGAPTPGAILGSLRGTVVPETGTWSTKRAARAVRAADVDAIVFVTARAFHPEVAAAAPRRILDLQDLFSRSYRSRAEVDRRPGARVAWRALARLTEPFEQRDHGVQLVAAGWTEALELGATWLPNTVAVAGPGSAITDRADATNDVLFFGKLSALPNLDAVRRLAALWPQLRLAVPSVTCVLAGSSVGEEVQQLARTHGWSIVRDFPDVVELCRRARVGVVPLRHANGIQNKVLEAAAAGLPQVVSPQALRGLAPGLPALVAEGTGATVRAIAALLRDAARRTDLAHRARAHVLSHYSVSHWTPAVHDLVHATP